MSIFKTDILAGRVALVTGGGSGINLGIARALGKHGATVAILGRTREKLDAAVAQMASEGIEAAGWAADVRDFDALETVVASIVERFGGLHILVNGAAGNFLSPAATLSANGFKSVMDIDARGTFNACRAAFAALSKQGGVILNISATQAFMPTPLQVHPGAAKAAIDKLTQDLALEWGPAGIRVVGLAPGGVEATEGMKRLMPPGLDDKVRAALPLKRFASVEEMGSIAVFLCSDAAGYVSGTTLVADGASAMPVSGVFWSMLNG